jgi:hypothetical protein
MLIPIGFFGGAVVGGAFEHVITTVLTSSAGSITLDLSALASTYKHLQIRYTGNYTTYGNFNMTFNADNNSANYYNHSMYSTGTGIGAGAGGGPQISYQWNGGFNATVIDIYDAFSTTKNKTSRAISGNTIVGAGTNFYMSHLWNSTAAINAITFSKASENLPVGSRWSVYGIKG